MCNLGSGRSFRGGSAGSRAARGVVRPVTPRARIAILTDDPGWHGRRLAARVRGARGRGTLRVARRLPRGPRGQPLGHRRSRLQGRGFPTGCSCARSRPGRFEQVTFRLAMLHALAEWGVPVYNSARAIERSVDKSMTSMLLRQAGHRDARDLGRRAGSERARRADARDRARATGSCSSRCSVPRARACGGSARGDDLPAAADYDGVYYLQRFVDAAPDEARDYRVFVIGGSAVAAMMRRGPGWVHNVAQGARCEAAAAGGRCLRARRARRARDRPGLRRASTSCAARDGAPVVIEVNGIPAWQGLQSVASIDIAARLAQDFVQRRRRGGGARRAASMSADRRAGVRSTRVCSMSRR